MDRHRGTVSSAILHNDVRPVVAKSARGGRQRERTVRGHAGMQEASAWRAGEQSHATTQDMYAPAATVSSSRVIS